MRNITIVIVHI